MTYSRIAGTGGYLPDRVMTNKEFEKIVANISGCGLSFNCKMPLEKGTRIRVSLQLSPSQTVVEFIASVVACDISKNRELPFKIRARIDEDEQTARELLIQHVVQKQSRRVRT